MSMARLWRDQGKRDEARDLLAPVYEWFTEGFDTLDLKEAKALLDALTPEALAIPSKLASKSALPSSTIPWLSPRHPVSPLYLPAATLCCRRGSSCEGFRMPAIGSGAACTGGRRPKASKERNRDGGRCGGAAGAMGI